MPRNINRFAWKVFSQLTKLYELTEMFPDKPNSFQSFSQAEKNAEKTEKESNELSRDRTHRLAVVAITLCVRDLCHIPKPHKNLFQ